MPGTAAELAERTGLPEQRVREAADRLVKRGAVARPMKKPGLYRLFPAMIELRDATVLWPDAPQELFELWERLVSNEMPKLILMLKALKVPPIVRVVPIERSVESRNAVLDIDSARKIFRDAELITALPCACRVQARRNNRGADCPAPEASVCMQTNGFAEVVLSRGLGQRLTNEEALKRVADAEEAGLVHMVRNNVQKDMFMCNCCSCCCTGLYMVNQTGYLEALAPSRFRVRLDPDACSGCGICQDRCQFHAITVNGIASVRQDRCYGCGNCVITCPDEALTLEEVRPVEHIRVK
jgi:NAD-dependent dihydropyrimidine dehydrogenase PreA subunit